MRHLLLLLAALLVLPSAWAQQLRWTYVSDFPANGSVITTSNHGLAVDPAGKVWIQSNSAVTRDSVAVRRELVVNSSAANCNQRTLRCRVTVLYVLNPDGTQASFSPLSIVTRPGGIRDTLGGGAFRTSTGTYAFAANSGRGLDAGPDGSIYAVFNAPSELWRINHQTGAIIDYALTPQLDVRGATGPSVDNQGNVFLTGVFNGDPLAIYDANLDFTGNVTARDRGFNRTVLALPDGNTVFSLNYSVGVATVYQRDNEFDTTWDSTGAAFRGMRIESATIHPTTGNIWVSAGSPNDIPASPWQQHTWYEFTPANVLATSRLANGRPTPLDSIRWNNPTDGRPRAIAFSPDGMTAYVGEFSQTTPNRGSVQKFTRMAVAGEAGPSAVRGTLLPNQPNPFTGATEIRFTLEAPAHARLRVLDMTGREVAVLVDQELGAGTHPVTFRPENLSAGVYLYQLQVDGRSTSRRMMYVR